MLPELRKVLVGVVLATAACSADSNEHGDADADLDTQTLPDADGDGISDADEGREDDVDTDRDGDPDYLDEDSDGDGIPDADEAGDDDAGTAPSDTDGDETEDFRDLDSDDNGIVDASESREDRDGDGRGDWRDTDDDGDSIADVDELGSPAHPVDTDGDGTADYQDEDSDGDTIGDHDERNTDLDEDGTGNWRDLDADGDGITDAEEAGDDDIQTPPIDTDHDRIPDFLDLDSDDDGLSDASEHENGTSPTDGDSDDDGVSDLVEQAAGTDPLDPASNPGELGDFVFVEPYEDDPTPDQDTLSFETSLQKADVYFLVDTTGSMGGEIANLSDALDTTLIPRIQDEIPDVWFGVGHHDDYPVCSGGTCYGSAGDVPFEQLQQMTGVAADAQAAARTLALGEGGDLPESQVPSLSAIATGLGDGSYFLDGPACDAGAFGYPCFRAGAVPIVVLITDVTMHNGPDDAFLYDEVALGVDVPSYAEAVDSLVGTGIRVVGVNSGTGRAPLLRLAEDTGAVDVDGSEMVFDIFSDGTGLGDAVVAGVASIANQVPIDIAGIPRDDPADAVDATRFIDHIVPNRDGDWAKGCEGGLETADTDADGVLDTFVGVLPGTQVCFDVIPKTNDFVEATDDPQLYRATIVVMGDGITELDERDVFFLVPPDIGGGGPK